MARPRMIDQDSVLDAAEAVVGRDGAAHLTLDAVASEAAISKASVIYDYGSKQSLIRAVVERRVKLETEKIREATEKLGDVPDADVRGRIVAAGAGYDTSEAVALNLCSALAQDAELRGGLRDLYRQQVDAIIANSPQPRRAITAFLAVEGLKALECYGLLNWPAKQRKEILEDIAALLDMDRNA